MSDPSRLPARPSLEQLRKKAKDRLRILRRSDPGAKLSGAQLEIARNYGFASWPKLVAFVKARGTPHTRSGEGRIDPAGPTVVMEGDPSEADWDLVFGVMAERGITRIRSTAWTDHAMERLARLSFVTSVEAAGARGLTDDGLRHLPSIPSLQELDLSGGRSAVTDRGLEVLADLPSLRALRLSWVRGVTDRGVSHLRHCNDLELVDLLGTETGDGVVEALRGKPRLETLKTGRRTTDAGLPGLADIPRFREWAGGDPRYDLMSADPGPTHLQLDGSITGRGLAALPELSGVFGLTLFGHAPSLRGRDLGPLAGMESLGYLGCWGPLCDDDAMRLVGAFPGLRMLMGQGTTASDAGFEGLSRSATLEHLWGRECPNLTGRGFEALGRMPSLRGLAVSCKGVADASLARLPEFPALTSFMPMDVSDAGFRHVGRCVGLEELWCMYCRDTGDDATRHLGSLEALRSYYAGRTRITDASLRILAGLGSLERVELWGIEGVTDEGIAALAELPELASVTVSACPGVSEAALRAFPPGVMVRREPG